MAINMSTAEFARSKAAQTKLVAEYKADLSRIITAIEKGQKYQELVKTIDKYWAGADANKFKKNIADYRNNIKQAAKNAERALENALTADYNQFTKNQSTHY